MIKVKSLQVKLSKALLWNSVEAVLYQSVLILHQLALFWTINPKLYGAQGALFAAVFLGITILNFSFDSALTPLFREASETKNEFRLFFLDQFIPQIPLLFFGALFLVALLFGLGHSLNYLPAVNPFWVGLLALFIASEGTKKNLRALLHLAFQNKVTASVEVFNIIGYTGFIWILYASGFTLTLELLTIPFILVSFITNLVLLLLLSNYYKSLPDAPFPKIIKSLEARFFRTRLSLYLNELARSLFSSNFLLPFFVYSGGLQKAGVATLINSLTHALTFFIQKVFGASGAALFANTKHLSFENKQSAFSYLNQKCFYALSSILLLFVINGPQFFYFKIGSQSIYTWSLIYLFFLAHFLENIFVVYEKLFIAEEKAEYITFCNLLSFAASLVVAYLLKNSSFIIILLSCMIMRLFAFLALAFFAKKLWRLKLRFTVSPLQICAPLTFSSLLFILLWWVG